MGFALMVICTMIIAQSAKEIVLSIFPNKREVEALAKDLEEIKTRLKNIDMKKIEALRVDIQAIKLASPGVRRGK